MSVKVNVVCANHHREEVKVNENGTVSSRADFCSRCEEPIVSREIKYMISVDANDAAFLGALAQNYLKEFGAALDAKALAHVKQLIRTLNPLNQETE